LHEFDFQKAEFQGSCSDTIYLEIDILYSVRKLNALKRTQPEERQQDLHWEHMPNVVPQKHLACNAPTGVKGQTLAKRVRLLGKSTESYGKPAMTRCC